MTLNWRAIRSKATGLIVPMVLICIWQAVVSQRWVNPQVLPSPWAVAKKWLEYRHSF